jgi:pimeloyl-ACP methyl ester carboxylesterase
VIAALAGVLGGLWGGLVSVRAATRGPQWALDYLKRSYPILLVLVLAGIAMMVLVSPGWVGVSLIYVTGIIAWMARSVSKSLEKVRSTGTFEPLSPDRQSAILGRVARWLLIGGAAIVLVAVLDYTWRGWPAAFDLALAAVLLIPGFRIRKQAEELVQPPPPVPGSSSREPAAQAEAPGEDT